MALTKIDNGGGKKVVVTPKPADGGKPPTGAKRPASGRQPTTNRTPNTGKSSANVAPAGPSLRDWIDDQPSLDASEWMIRGQVKKRHPSWSDAGIDDGLRPRLRGYVDEAKTGALRAALTHIVQSTSSDDLAAESLGGGHSLIDSLARTGVPRTADQIRVHAQSRVQMVINHFLGGSARRDLDEPEAQGAADAVSPVRRTKRGGAANEAQPAQRGNAFIPPAVGFGLPALPGRPIPAHVQGHHTVSMRLPGFLVCGPEGCAQVEGGYIQVSSSKASLSGLRVRGRRGRDLQFKTGGGARVSDPGLWQGEASGLPGQIGTIWGHQAHMGGGMRLSLPKSTVVNTQGGRIKLQDQQTRVDVVRAIRRSPRFGLTTAGYRFTITTQLTLPDGSSVTERLHMAVRLVPINKLPKALQKEARAQHVTWGHLKPLPQTEKQRHNLASSFSKVAASDVARSANLALIENPGSADRPPHDEGEVQGERNR